MRLLNNGYYPNQEIIDKLIKEINESSKDEDMYEKLQKKQCHIYANYAHEACKRSKIDVYDHPTGKIGHAYKDRLDLMRFVDVDKLDDELFKKYEDACARLYIMSRIVSTFAFFLAEFKIEYPDDPNYKYYKSVYSYFKRFIERFLEDTNDIAELLKYNAEETYYELAFQDDLKEDGIIKVKK